jgi:hypothetical protein
VTWAEYAEAARELAQVRRADVAAHADRASLAGTAERDLARLDKHLDAQRTQLVSLAKTLKLPEPWFGAVERSPLTDLPEALHRAADAAKAAEAEALTAEQAGARPALFPSLAPTTRNVAIYSGWALVGWLLQCGLTFVSSETDLSAILWSLCGLPALAFFGAYLTISTVGQPRVGTHYPKQPGLGGAITFGGMLLVWIALVVLRSFVSG